MTLDPVTDGTAFNGVNEESPNPDVTYEVFIWIVTVIALALLLLYYFAPLSTEVQEVLFAVDAMFVCPVLLFDVGRTLYKASNRKRYALTWGWLDFLGSVPWFPVLRLLRLARLLRVSRSLRASTPKEVWGSATQSLAQSTLMVAVFTLLLVLILGSSAIVLVENSSTDANIKNGQDAVWWTFVTVATVGYGDRYPVTPGGRAIGVAVMIVGVSVFSIFTGYLATVFQNRNRKHTDDELVRIRAELEEIKQLLSAERQSRE